MLAHEPWRYKITELDLEVFRQLIADDHPLKLALEHIPWESFRGKLESFYSPDKGAPPYDAVRMFKLEFLRYHYNLSDRQVIGRSETDIACRYFLQIGVKSSLPDPTSLTRFRGRLGAEGFHAIFDQLIACAREQGIVKDRLRLKDASHVVANIAVPTTLKLIAQIRSRLLESAKRFDPEGAEGHRINIELIREQTDGQGLDERLTARVNHLQDILQWADGIQEPSPNQTDAATMKAWRRFFDTRELARKILFDQANPEAGHRTLSVVDPDARRGKHGDWYEGYVLDILMDADSELITQINTLEAGGDEAKDAVELVRREESAHGNDIQAMTMDGAGFNGEMMHALEDAEDGPHLRTYVRPKKEAETERFSAADFILSEDRSHVTCPGGEQSQYRQRNARDTGYLYRFLRDKCANCPLLAHCMPDGLEGKFGRTVAKNDYEKQYQRARERVETPEYVAAHRKHPAVERKLNEVLNHHHGRRAKYWGLAKVHLQECMTCFTVNVKRLIQLGQQRSRLEYAPAA